MMYPTGSLISIPDEMATALREAGYTSEAGIDPPLSSELASFVGLCRLRKTAKKKAKKTLPYWGYVKLQLYKLLGDSSTLQTLEL